MTTDIHAATQAIREAFESWWTNYRDGNPESLSRRGDGYFWYDADSAWDAWQAATQARDAEIAARMGTSRALLEEASRLLKTTPPVNRDIYLGGKASFGVQAKALAQRIDAAIDAARKDGV